MEDLTTAVKKPPVNLYLVIFLTVLSTSIVTFLVLQQFQSKVKPPMILPTESADEATTGTAEPTPIYTTTFEDQTFFWATHIKTNEQGVYVTTTNIRKNMSPAPTKETGVFFPTLPVSEKIRTTYGKVLFSDLKNIQKLLPAPANFPGNMGSIISGYSERSYIFTIYNDQDCSGIDPGAKALCTEYHYKVTLSTTNTASISLIRTYVIGVLNDARKTSGIEVPQVALSENHVAMHVNGCHWCGGGNKPNIYIVNTQNGTEESKGAIGNLKAVDGLTYTFQNATQKKYVCPASDPICPNGMYPEFDYIIEGTILTGTLK
jgi:hypothetical protein